MGRVFKKIHLILLNVLFRSHYIECGLEGWKTVLFNVFTFKIYLPNLCNRLYYLGRLNTWA